MKKVIIYAILAALFVACSGKVSKPEFLKKEKVLAQIEKTDYPTQDEYPNDDNVLIYYNTEVDISFEDEGLVQLTKVHVIKKIFKNIIENSKISIPLDHKDQLVYLEGRTITADSVFSILKSDDISYVTLKSGGEEGQQQLVNFTFQKVRENSIVEYTYLIKSVNSYLGRLHEISLVEQPIIYNNLSIAMNNNMYEYSNSLSVRVRKFTDTKNIIMVFFSPIKPIKISYSINAKGLDGYIEPRVTRLENKSVFSWTFRNIPSFEIEEDMPPVRFLIPKITFQPSLIEDWHDLALPYIIELKKLRNESINDKVAAKKDEIVKEHVNKLKIIELLTDYVRKIRYEANRFGEGGTIPMTPDKVIEKGYADCKDKSFLLYALLREAKINAYPVLVMTNDEDILLKNNPIFSFNHMIVKVELDSANSIWIDPTVTHCKLGEIPANIQGAGCLVLRLIRKDEKGDLDKSGFEVIPENNYNDNNILFKYDLMVKNTDSLYYNVQMVCKGEFGLKLRNTKFDANDNDIKVIIKNYMDEEFKDVEILDLKYQNLENPDNPFIIEFKFNAGGKMKKLTKNMYSIDIDPFRSLRKTKWLNQNTKRRHPVYFDYQYSINKEANIILGDKVKFVESPAPGDISNDMTDYSRMLISDDDRKFEYRENFASKKIFILTEDTDKAKKLFTDIKSLQGNSLVVELE